MDRDIVTRVATRHLKADTQVQWSKIEKSVKDLIRNMAYLGGFNSTHIDSYVSDPEGKKKVKEAAHWLLEYGKQLSKVDVNDKDPSRLQKNLSGFLQIAHQILSYVKPIYEKFLPKDKTPPTLGNIDRLYREILKETGPVKTASALDHTYSRDFDPEYDRAPWAEDTDAKKKEPRDIKIKVRTLDRHSEQRRFKTLEPAQKYAYRWVGKTPEISENFGYAVSGDGMAKVMPEGVSMQELFPDAYHGSSGRKYPRPGTDAHEMADWQDEY